MTDAHLYRAINARARHFARMIEDAGNFVGPNDMELSNRLWALSVAMRDYGKTYINRIDRGTIPERTDVPKGVAE